MGDVTPDPTAIDWFSPQGCIQFRQIAFLPTKLLATSVVFPIDVLALENLKLLQMELRDAEDAGVISRLFHPDLETGVPCRSLTMIARTCKGFPGPLLKPLISLAEERKRVGHRLEFVRLPITRELDPHFLEELREHVERVQIEECVKAYAND